MTALAASRFGLPIAVAPVRASREPQRASAWTEPEPWIVAALLATGIAVIARHPIARAIGTEDGDATLNPSVVATAPPTTATTSTFPTVSTPAAAAAPVPTHAPRNPFRALVDASGAIVAPDAAAVAAATAGTTVTTPRQQSATPTTHPAATASATCAGTVHTVVAGDTLWSLAAHIVKSNDTGTINVVWHRIYKANTPPLGSNPSLLPVGAKLCLPSQA